MTHKVSDKLCAKCEYRSRDGEWHAHHCNYASITGECRLDPPGTCTHYKLDKLYDSARVRRKKEEQREKCRKYREAHRPEKPRPVGRPRTRTVKKSGDTEKTEKGLPSM